MIRPAMLGVSMLALVACGTSPDDRMEHPPQDEYRGQEQIFEGPVISGEIHEANGDTVIVPTTSDNYQEGVGTRMHHGMGTDDGLHAPPDRTEPVMPEKDGPHHSGGNVGTVEEP